MSRKAVSWLWLIPAFLLMVALGANYFDMRESWHLGGPGARHAEDVDKAREKQDQFGMVYRPWSAR